MLDTFVCKYRLYIIAFLGALMGANEKYPVMPSAWIAYVGAVLAFFTLFNPANIHEVEGGFPKRGPRP